ncbi:Mth938-like domain-containing protein [Sphingomonas radiodurans]|uniref:Mth938-like domain-containing protein n=1 Tax=Sphingomonas radiodurans TaxID=2890321 RepID=UPI001E42AFFA|nr:Mth938-like domain-containing protein [Sphingomonas radiodurans]WBH18319.1 Mth938-like domain-containing protein [Sphingomonas radiodurans]
MNLDRSAGGPLVRGFTPKGFRIDDTTVLEAALLTVSEAIAWTPPPLGALDEAALAAILDPAPEFVLLGTGNTLARPPRALVAALDARGIGIEPMDSRAAARAWGVLRSEGRQVSAALYPLGA